MVSECVSLVRFLDFNKAALDLYGATDQAEFQSGLVSLVPAEARRLFVDELVWIAQGRTSFTWEGVNRRLNGELIEHDETARLFTSPRQKLTEDYITGRFG